MRGRLTLILQDAPLSEVWKDILTSSMLLPTVTLYCVTSDAKLGSSLPGVTLNFARLALSIVRYYGNAIISDGHERIADVARITFFNEAGVRHLRILSPIFPLLIYDHGATYELKSCTKVH